MTYQAWLIPGIVLALLVQPRALPAAAEASGMEAQQEFMQQNWTKEEGLPSNEIAALHQTRDGYLWIGTRQGLARFDGLKFTVYDRFNTPAFEDHWCTALAETRDGALYIGTGNGLVLFKNGQFSRHRWGDQSQSVMALHPGENGGVWIGGHHGLWFHDGIAMAEAGQFREPVLATWAIGNSVWAGTSGSSFKGRIAPKDEFNQIVPSVGPVWAYHADASGTFWMLAGSGSAPHDVHLYRFADEQWKRVSSTPTRNLGGYFLLSDTQGKIWMPGGVEALVRYDGVSFQRVHVPLAHPGDVFKAACFDSDGNLWLGTENSGLQCLRPRRVHTPISGAQLPHENVATGCEAADGSLWFGTLSGVARIDPATARVRHYFLEPGQHVTNRVRSIIAGDSGDVWVGLHGGGVHHFIDEAWPESFLVPGGHDDNKVNVICRDEERLWVGDMWRLTLFWKGRCFSFVRLRQARRQLIDIPRAQFDDSEQSLTVRALVKDAAGHLWVGTDGGGLLRISEFPQGYELPPKEAQSPLTLPIEVFASELSNPAVWSLHLDEQKSEILWIGTEKGLNRLQDGRCTAWTVSDGLPDDGIRSIVEDDAGNLWLGVGVGIVCVSKDVLEAVAEDRARPLPYGLYGPSDGLPIKEMNGELNDPAAWKTRDGQLWFGTAKGPVMIDPRELRQPKRPPRTVIEEVVANGTSAFKDGGVREAFVPVAANSSNSPALQFVPGAARVLEIRYTGIDFSKPSRLQFRHRLDPYDKDWKEAGDRRAAFYSNLSPGRYRFHLAARREGSAWNGTGAPLLLTIKPYYYQTATFWVIVAGCAGAAVLGVHRARLNRAKKLEQLETELRLAKQRDQFLTLLHDDISTELSSIISISTTAAENASPAGQPLKRIAALSRGILHNVRDTLWASNPEFDSLGETLAKIREFSAGFLEDHRLQGHVEIASDWPVERVSGEFRRNLLLLVKEALHNSAKHADANRIEISITPDSGSLLLSIRDDGKGFSVEDRSRNGNGLKNMNKRAAELGGVLQIASGLTGGTGISVRLPLVDFDE